MSWPRHLLTFEALGSRGLSPLPSWVPSTGRGLRSKTRGCREKTLPSSFSFSARMELRLKTIPLHRLCIYHCLGKTSWLITAPAISTRSTVGNFLENTCTQPTCYSELVDKRHYTLMKLTCKQLRGLGFSDNSNDNKTKKRAGVM